MIILDKPYVSEFLKSTISGNLIPVLKTPLLDELNLNGNFVYKTEAEFIEFFKQNPDERLYTNSENAINWISRNLSFTSIPEKINLFKDKVLFRDLIHNLYPDFWYKSLNVEDFDNIDIKQVPKPFIIKPAIGFFSMAVYRVNSNDDWELVKTKIHKELERVKGIYPREVMDTGKFIMEQIIEGDEYAIDASFNHQGELVIYNIMHHVFASGNDFSDRLYITSEKIMREKLADFGDFLSEIGKLAGLRNFPLHVEVRVDETGKIQPIEVNPLRFGAWCTTADATWYAYGFSSIAAFFSGNKPDWEEIFASKKGKTYAMMVIENSTGHEAVQIKSFNYDKLLADFEKPLELRKIDWHKYPVFAFLFAETRNENFAELERILKSDLSEYIVLKQEFEH
jgi:hypothetical protein